LCSGELTSTWNEVRILGVRIHNVSRSRAVEIMERFVTSRKPHIICTPNVDYIIQAQRDKELRDIINSADLAVSDGMGVVCASRLLGTPLFMNVGGRRVVPEMCRLASLRGFRVYLLGARPGIAQRAADRLRQDHPGLQISGIEHGYFSLEEECNIVESVRKSHSDMLILAMGTPKQEKWMYHHKLELEVPVIIGVGSTLDRISGAVSVPPKWVTDFGLEWLYRIFQEPRRLGKRYLINDPIFFWWVLKQRIGLGQKRECP